MKEPITVRQLIERLSKVHPDNVVMIRCDDEYYNNVLTLNDIKDGIARKVGPFEWVGPSPHQGHPPRTYKYDGGWSIDDEHETQGEILEKKLCVIICARSW